MDNIANVIFVKVDEIILFMDYTIYNIQYSQQKLGIFGRIGPT